MATIEIFPSVLYRETLLRKRCSKEGYRSLTDDERWAYHAYDYGWRRVALGDASDQSPLDPERQWFNPSLVNQAEGMWRRKLSRPIHPRAPDPTPEDIQHVARIARIARQRLGDFAERNRQAFAPLQAEAAE